MLDQALIGSLLTGVLALASQVVAKTRCYVACKRDPEGEYCEPLIVCGFMDTPLADMDRSRESSQEESPPP